MTEKRLKAIFRGRVQGVGFRYTTQGLARRLRVKGIVRNLPDGAVEVVVEGEEPQLHAFLRAIQDSQVGVYIRDLETEWSDSQSAYDAFHITF